MGRETAGGTGGAARWVAALSALFWVLPFFGLVDLAVPLAQTPNFYDAYLLETGWGVLYTFMVGAAFVSLTIRPSLVMPLVQVGLAALCLAVTAVAAASWMQLLPAVLLASNSYIYWRAVPGRGSLRGRWHRAGIDPVLGLLALALAAPALVFAVDMVGGFRQGRFPRDDDTWGIDHWPTQGALGLTVVLVAVAVAVGARARWTGTAVSGGCVALAAGWFGYWSATFPRHAGSAGETWGVALVVWACVFTGAVAWRVTSRGTHPGRRRHRVRRSAHDQR